jgi:aryl-alcohol dehydrogenase-like predicted oxidoreductase
LVIAPCPNILLIPGTSKVKQMEEKFKAAAINFSSEDITVLDNLNAG